MPTTLLLAASLLVAPPAGDWPQWRGPNRDGVVQAQTPWPQNLKEQTLKQVWRVENLGPSYSGPLVVGDRIFTTQTVDKKREVVTAHDRKTGRELWKQQWEGSLTVPFFAAANGSWIRSTPAYSENRLYVAGIRDFLVCLDANTGEVLWKLNFPELFGSSIPAFGFVCSPLVVDDAVYVQAGAAFVKLDKATGKVAWKSLKDDGGMMGSAFSSPIVADLGGKKQIVVQTRTDLAGVDPESGQELWKKTIPSFRGMNILTPQPFRDGIFTSTYGGTTQLIQVNAADNNQWSTKNSWSVRYEGNMSSPVVVDEHAYFLGKDQRLVCFDLSAGKQAWRSEKSFGKYWSLVANGNMILGLDQKGILYLLKANSQELEIVDQRQIAEGETWAHLAVAGEHIVIRDLYGLTLFQWQ